MKTLVIILISIFFACNSETVKYTNDKSFDSFYIKFINDSIFQMERIKFPVQGQYEDYDTQRNWTRENWPLITWNFKEETNKKNDSIAIINKEDEYFVGSYCLDCGFSFQMQFEKFNDKWFLTYRQENNY